MFSKNVYVYNVFVNDDEINLNVSKESNEEVISKLGLIKLSSDENIIDVVVMNDDVKTIYTLNIFKNFDNKYDENDSSLKFLIIDNYEIKFNKNTYNYYVNLNKDETEIKFNYLTRNPDATTEVNGGTNFIDGNNTIEIKVISSNKMNNTIYTINVYKTPSVFKEVQESDKNINIFNNREFNSKEITVIKIVISIVIFLILLIIFILLFFKKNKIIRK